MAGRGLTDEELAAELENMSDNDEITGFSDDSIEDKDFSPANDSYDSSSEDDDAAASPESDDSDSSDDNVPLANLVHHRRWEPVAGDRNNFAFTSLYTGGNPNVVQELQGQDPIAFFKHFIDDEVVTLLVTETNRFAAQNTAAGAANRTKSRMTKWVDTNNTEMQKFLGITMWMGLMQLPQLRDYWSTNMLYENGIPKIMSRNRFEMLLSMFHICDNEQPRLPNDRLFKISNLLAILQPKFKESYIPEELVCIDESNVPFRGRIHFRQYIPNKRHRYGIKVFKLCVSGGYTWSFKIYTGKEERADDTSVAEKVVTDLMDGLLDSGRTLYTDNWYTSVSLSKKLVARNTHLVGTLRANRKNNPPDVVKAKLKRGEVVAQQNEDKTVVLKWRDKRDILMLSTKHDDSLVSFVHRGQEIRKPATVVEYNHGKAFIDLSDQMAAYAPYVRRTVKWYKRLAFHLLTSTTVVNALHLYNKVNTKKMGIIKFKEAIIQSLVRPNTMPIDRPSPSRQKHLLKEAEGQKRVTRKRCSPCYKTMSRQRDAAFARKNAKKVNTFCETCKIPMCLSCFQKHEPN